jgi:hypothetical protein
MKILISRTLTFTLTFLVILCFAFAIPTPAYAKGIGIGNITNITNIFKNHSDTGNHMLNNWDFNIPETLHSVSSVFNKVHFTFPHNGKDDNFGNKPISYPPCKKNDDENDCQKHPERKECNASVPEFGVIPGAIALLTSGGTFIFLKKRSH